jgi:hypothetical protein
MLPENKFQLQIRNSFLKKELKHGNKIQKPESKATSIFNIGAPQKQMIMQNKPPSRSGVNSAKPSTIDVVCASVKKPLERRKSSNFTSGVTQNLNALATSKANNII